MVETDPRRDLIQTCLFPACFKSKTSLFRNYFVIAVICSIFIVAKKMCLGQTFSSSH